jgi:hypothetical protein
MSYAYLGSRPRAIDDTHADNLLDLRSDLRTPAGAVMAAPLAIAMLDAATINLESMKVLAATQVDVDVIDCAIDVREALLTSQITTEARSQVFTEARIYDADDPGRAIGFGTANWSVFGPMPRRFCLPEPRAVPGRGAALPPLWQAYSGRRRPDGLLEIPCLELEVSAERLHHAPMLVVTEAVALEYGAQMLGTDALMVDHLAMTIVAPGRIGPFVASPVFSAVEADTFGCRVELRDIGRDNRLVAATFVRMQTY